MLPNDTHIRLIAAGNVTAFRQLHRALYSRMFYFAYRMCRNREFCEDLIQDTFIKYWETRETFDNLRAVKVYLYSMLRNKMMNLLRDEANRQRILATIELPDHPGEDHLLIVAEIAGEVNRAVADLAPQSRRVIELSMSGMSVTEVATELNISPNTVKILKKSAYKKLRTSLFHLRTLLFFLLS